MSSTPMLDGRTMKAMLIGGVENIRSNVNEINDLNVFPVPDGDTGPNMTKTLEGGISEISRIDADDIASIIEKFAKGVILGARGNSGVILSQIFSGIKDELAKHDRVSARELAEAYRSGIERSYAAVTNPTEGTILTVFREATEFAAKKVTEKSTIEDFYKLHIAEARRSLTRTKEILPVLAEADVVDSGAAGYLCIAVGMYWALTGKINAALYEAQPETAPAIDIDSFTRDSVLEFGYCTEFLLRLTTAKVDPDAFEASEVIRLLESMGGESIVSYKDGDIVKVHVHTFNPGEVLAACQRYGEFLTVKIENMSVGHSGDTSEQKPVKKAKRPALSVLAVATGEGICSLFTDMGADGIISGGQTANPSTEEFIEAFRKYDAENIFVLPNNKNVFLAAKQAADMWDTSKVYIIPTATLMQGYSALAVKSPGVKDYDRLARDMESAAREVVSGEVTFAVRDVTLDGIDIVKGDFIAITDGRITADANTPEQALVELLSAVEDMDDYELITLFVGRDVSDDTRVEITDRIEDLYPDHEVVVYKGGQDVYCYMVAIE